jgi:hypothetical protein
MELNSPISQNVLIIFVKPAIKTNDHIPELKLQQEQ